MSEAKNVWEDDYIGDIEYDDVLECGCCACCGCTCGLYLEELKETNKYEEALETIAMIHGIDGLVSQFLDLKELVDKSIPKKPIVVSEQFTHTGYDDLYIDVLKCPSCEQDVYYDRCCQNNDCRQAIDWSERYHEIFT